MVTGEGIMAGTDAFSEPDRATILRTVPGPAPI
jgi:hypothetical protein